MNLQATPLISFLGVLFFAGLANAAPIPGTSTSELISQESGLFRSLHDFQLEAGQSDWILSPNPTNNSYIEAIYRAPKQNNGVQPALTVRVDKLDKEQTLKSYMNQWRQDYPRLGFDILKAKPVQVKGQRAFLIDLINQMSQKQLRQVVFLKNKKAVILTCRDHSQTFSKSVNSCNEIIRNFRWL